MLHSKSPSTQSPWLLLATLTMSACASREPPVSPKTAPSRESVVPPPGYELAWHDEFDGSGATNDADYSYEVGMLRNHEAQTYTDHRTENIRRERGLLVIEARKESFAGADFTSGSLTTRGRHEFLYGRLEARAKIPTGRGTWPAIWLLGSNVRETGWPRCGEMDVMENVGFDPDALHATVHTEAYNHLRNTQRGGTLNLPEAWLDFHVYALDWQPDRASFFIDGREVLSFENDQRKDLATWPFSQPVFLIMNLAIGGDWGGAHGIDPAIFPARLEIDYVRYFRRVAQAALAP